MRAAALRYRVMAYITGVLIIVVCFVGIPMQLAAHNTWIVNNVGTVHGFLYIVYIVFAYILAQKLKMKTGPTLLLLLAGTVGGRGLRGEVMLLRSGHRLTGCCDGGASSAASAGAMYFRCIHRST